VGQEQLGPSYFFIPLGLGPLKSLVWWEVPLGYIALRSFLFLQEQIKDIITSSLPLLPPLLPLLARPLSLTGNSSSRSSYTHPQMHIRIQSLSLSLSPPR
jgi:hypothetical protein